MRSADRDLLDEQIAYYRARAPEYDATSTPDDDPFAAHGLATREHLRRFDPTGHVIEIAAGTGQWTPILAEFADRLVVTDASPEMLQLNADRLSRPDIDYRVADAFELEATHEYDAAVFGFFLSHVPMMTFASFWNTVAGLLAPGGRVFFVDEAWPGVSAEDWIDRATGITQRRLRDGSAHRAVKVLWIPAELELALADLGWRASVHREGPFYWGTAWRQQE